MKRLIITLCIIAGIFQGIAMSNAGDYANITSNTKIATALQALRGIGQGDVISILNGNNATGQPIRVLFRNLAIYGCGNCEALTAKTRSGGLVIYINEEHKNAPVEAIACLIAHESQHHTYTHTKQEELRAWLKETATWNAFVRKDRTLAYSNNSLVKRENYIARLYVRNDGVKAIEKVIAGNAQYASLN